MLVHQRPKTIVRLDRVQPAGEASKPSLDLVMSDGRNLPTVTTFDVDALDVAAD